MRSFAALNAALKRVALYVGQLLKTSEKQRCVTVSAKRVGGPAGATNNNWSDSV